MSNLRIKILIKINILAFKDIDLAISTRTSHINSYRTTFKLLVISSLRPYIRWEIILKRSISILTRSYIAIPIEYLNLLFDNYIFEPIEGYPITLFIAVIDLLFYTILARNNLD